MLGIDRLGYWANQYGFGTPTGIDLPGEASGIVPTNEWKLANTGATIFTGETYQASIGQGYDNVTPLQLINAYAALANGGKLYQPQVVREVVGPDGNGRAPVQAEAHPQDEGQGERAANDAECRAEHRDPPPHVQPRRHADQGRRQVRHGGVRRAGPPRAACRTTPGSSGWVPKDPYHGSFDKTDSKLIAMAFVYDSRTNGNAGTEVVKYFFQLHFGIKHDYRNFDLMERGNFFRND